MPQQAGVTAPIPSLPAGIGAPYPASPAGPAVPPTRLTSTTKLTFPTGGVSFNAFEQEIVAAVDTSAVIIARYVNIYRDVTPGVTDSQVTDYTTRLNSFVTNYATWLAS